MYLNCLVISLINSIHFLLLSEKDTTAKVYHRKQWTIGNVLMTFTLLPLLLLWIFLKLPSPQFMNSESHASGVHYNDVIMNVIASQITSLTIVYSTVYADADQRKHQSSASLAFVGKSPVTGEFPAQRAIVKLVDPLSSCRQPIHYPCYIRHVQRGATRRGSTMLYIRAFVV